MRYFDEPTRLEVDTNVRPALLLLMGSHDPGRSDPTALLEVTDAYLRLNPRTPRCSGPASGWSARAGRSALDRRRGTPGMDFGTWEGTEALGRRRLLLRMAFALEDGDRRYAHWVLVQATRWIRRRGGDDPVVREAREELRRRFSAH